MAEPTPLEESRWALASAHGADVPGCEAFLAAVERWPRHVWLEIGAAASPPAPARREHARNALHAIVRGEGHEVTAWYLSDLVRTCAAMAHEPAATTRAGRTCLPPATASDRATMAAACRVVEDAALAHLLRPRLPAEHHAALTEPVSVSPPTTTPSATRRR